MIRCDHPECIAPSIGYGDRQLQGPFYCSNHEAWALAIVAEAYADLYEVIAEEEDCEVVPINFKRT